MDKICVQLVYTVGTTIWTTCGRVYTAKLQQMYSRFISRKTSQLYATYTRFIPRTYPHQNFIYSICYTTTSPHYPQSLLILRQEEKRN